MTTLESVAIILATLLGPVLALVVSFIREEMKAKRAGRLQTFRTLMVTRTRATWNEHVDALNMVEIEFRGMPKVLAAYRDYFQHLCFPSNPTTDQWWGETRASKLAALLHQMSIAVGTPIDEAVIRHTVYAPRAWAKRDTIEEYLVGLAQGTASLPIHLAPSSGQGGSPPTPPSAAPPSPLPTPPNPPVGPAPPAHTTP